MNHDVPDHAATGAAPSRSGSERVKDLSDVPSFPAVYAAALTPRRGRAASRRDPVLPEVTYRVRSVRVDAERAASFDHLMGGPATELVHPGVLHVLSFPVSLALMARGDFPFPLLGLVHLRNQVLQHRPVTVGEKVDVECRVRDLQPHRKGRTFEAVSTILSRDGQIIATDVSTYLAKGGSGSGDVHGVNGADATGGPDSAPGGAPNASGDAPNAARGVGTRRRSFEPPRPTGRWKLAADIGRRYGEVSGDVNPIHMSGLSAKAFGFPKAIAHGMYTASRAFTESRVDLSRPLRWDVSFDAPVTLPGTLLVSYDDHRDAGTIACVGWRPGTGEKGPRRCFEVQIQMLG